MKDISGVQIACMTRKQKDFAKIEMLQKKFVILESARKVR